jgi:UrcA family protein
METVFPDSSSNQYVHTQFTCLHRLHRNSQTNWHNQEGKKMNKRVMNRLVFATLLALALPSAAMATSPSQRDDINIKVAWDDLNIHSAAGAKILYTRVERAAEKACGVATLAELGSVKRVYDAKECADYLVEKAVKQIDSEELQKIHAS